MKRIAQYTFGMLFLFIGFVAVILEEPLYGFAIILLGLLLLPQTSKLLSAKIKTALFTGISILILASLSMFGRKTYDRVETKTAREIAALSVHPIDKEKVNNLDYYFIEQGKGETILFLLGFPDMANTWDETITELSKTHRVIAPFLRGYYPTGIPGDKDYSVETIAGDMVNLMTSLGIDNFTVVGQDWGASITYAVANLAPNRVQKAVAIAIPHPTCLVPTPELLFSARHFLLFGTGNYGVRYSRKNDFEYIERLYRRWSPDYKNYKESSDAIKETFKFPNRLEAAIGYYASFGEDQNNAERTAFYQALPKMPILFMVGENDDIATKEVVESMESTMPAGSKTIVFKNAGHFLHQEIFPEYIKELKLFLGIS